MPSSQQKVSGTGKRDRREQEVLAQAAIRMKENAPNSKEFMLSAAGLPVSHNGWKRHRRNGASLSTFRKMGL
jgi:hypothetical protein